MEVNNNISSDENNNELKYAFSASAYLYTDQDKKVYKTESVFDIDDENTFGNEDEAPHEFFLAIVVELENISDFIKEKMGFSKKDIEEFKEERKSYQTEDSDKIDKAIDNLFDDNS